MFELLTLRKTETTIEALVRNVILDTNHVFLIGEYEVAEAEFMEPTTEVKYSKGSEYVKAYEKFHRLFEASLNSEEDYEKFEEFRELALKYIWKDCIDSLNNAF